MKPLIRVARIVEMLRDAPAQTDDWLSDSEQTRLQRLLTPSRRKEYLAGHWLARCLLADVVGGNARDHALQERPSKPPAVIGSRSALQLSLSHSADWIACAISVQPIGIDIEQRHPPRNALLGFAHLLAAENDLPAALDVDALLLRWVAKEAWIKQAHGSALPDQLAAVKLRQVDAPYSNIRLITTALFHLGVAAHDVATVEIPLDAKTIAISDWYAQR